MRLGALLGPIPPTAAATFLADQARAFEHAGFESVWSVQAIGRGFPMTDPFVALAVAAAATRDVEIGTAVVQVPLYHAVDLAHRVLSLMQVCGARLRLGVGAGSTRNDFDAFERDYARRFRDLDAKLATLRRVFADGRDGGVDLTPWPAVRGGPPLLLGAWGGPGVERAATEFDGWIASAAKRSADAVLDALKRFRAAGGRRAVVSTIQVGGNTDLGELHERLARFAAGGFDDAVVMLLPGGPTPDAIRRLV
ncbi:MAG TPA: LLM class flavin-dependent oxidoreductase [Pseudomonadales bacterium]|nr:LLM class flavin-dependent oxidoreductase [Pseudomonadales bacterium]